MAKKSKIILSIIILVLLVVLFYFISQKISLITGKSILGLRDGSNMNKFAKCLAEKGAKMYGSYRCGHCTSQKEMFGEGFQFIDYTECSAGLENSNPEACREAGIKGYPTWRINGELYPGKQALEKLSELTGCSI